jgi:hypothetical protein
MPERFRGHLLMVVVVERGTLVEVVDELLVVVERGTVVEVVVERGTVVEVVVDGGVDVDVDAGAVVEVVDEVVVDELVLLDEAGTTTWPLDVVVVPDLDGPPEPEPDVSAKTRTATAIAATTTASTVLTGNRRRGAAVPDGSLGPTGPRGSATTGVAMTEVRSMSGRSAALPPAGPDIPAPAIACCSVVSKSGGPIGWVAIPPVSLGGATLPVPCSGPGAPVSTSSVWGPAFVPPPFAGGVSLGSASSAEVPGRP